MFKRLRKCVPARAAYIVPGMLLLTASVQAQVVINEVDADTPGTDVLEFVELYGTPGLSLDAYVLVFFNGSLPNDPSYAAYDLDGYSLDVNGFFVAGNAGVATVDLVFPSNGLQNGVDAVGLYTSSAAAFPNGTAATDVNLVDALVYDTNDSDDAALIAIMTPGQAQIDEDANGNKDTESNSRVPDGGTARNTSTYSQEDPTPGARNAEPPVSFIFNEILADGATATDANGDGVIDGFSDEFVEILNTGPSSVDISGWTLYESDFPTIPRHTFPASTVVPAGDPIVVFGGGDLSGFDSNILAQTASIGAPPYFHLNDAGDTVVLKDGSTVIAQYTYGAEGGNDESLTRSPDVSGGVPLVGHTTAPGSGGSEHSPGTCVDGNYFSSGCPTGEIFNFVINEILADPAADITGDANADGVADFSDDEFVELVNNSAGVINISGWELRDGASTVLHTFPASSWVPAGCPIVVFGAGSPSATFGTIPVQTASSGQLSLVASGGTIKLKDGVLEVAYTFGSEAGNDESVTRSPDVTGGEPLVGHSTAPGAGGALFSPGLKIDGSAFTPDCQPTSGTAVEIFDIQSAGLTSPYAGQVVTTEDNIVTVVGPVGFFIQTPAARSDGDINTSDGIYVYTGPSPSVSVGDNVDVTGDLVEYFDFTEFTNFPVVSINSSGNPVPAPVVFDATVPSPDPTAPSCAIEYECYEGMIISITGGTVNRSNQHFGTDPIAEVFVVASNNRAFRETGIEYPGVPGLPVWDGNPEIFELDPDKLGMPNIYIPGGSTFDAVGALGFDYGDYELWPTSLTVTEATLPDPVKAQQAEELSIGSLNLYRLFDDVDDPEPSDNGDTVSPAEYALRLDKFSDYVRNVLLSPDILAVQEVEKLGTLDDLATEIQADDPSVIYTAYLLDGNDVGGIDVGYLVQESVVQVNNVSQLGAAETYTWDSTVAPLHDRPPLLLEAEVPGASVDPAPFNVLNVHMRSMGGIDGSDGDRVRYKRLEQAKSVANMVQTLQTTETHQNLVVLGDFNAFEFTDGYVDVMGQIVGDVVSADNMLSAPSVVMPHLVNQTTSLPQADRYSFAFQGSAQTLDHGLTTSALSTSVTGYGYGRANADAADGQIEVAGTPLRSSDHDGFVLYIDTGGLLPIELAGFTAMTEDRKVRLEWQTDSESGNAGFAIDHMEPGLATYEEIAFVEGSLSTTRLRLEEHCNGEPNCTTSPGQARPQTYTHTINDLLPGLHRFRLRSIDLDGTEHIGGEVDVTIEMLERFLVDGVYPNPLNPTATMAFAVRETGKVSVRLYDAMGRLVKTVLDSHVEGGAMQRVRIDGSGLSSGVYLLRLRGNDFEDVRAVTIIR